ncbi:hypothetical protein [Sphingomonas echinoides]|uniref:hypothetical protein n=1 Tax=Sphingomonas echinoides TaxID=59803 RepID=UPI00241345F2|nr:hypothetical protein [Sphingomonas echinoides]
MEEDTFWLELDITLPHQAPDHSIYISVSVFLKYKTVFGVTVEHVYHLAQLFALQGSFFSHGNISEVPMVKVGDVGEIAIR